MGFWTCSAQRQSEAGDVEMHERGTISLSVSGLLNRISNLSTSNSQAGLKHSMTTAFPTIELKQQI
jgi:hypothetical protein